MKTESSLFAFLLHLQNIILIGDWLVLVPISLVELILELHPVQTQRMQETLHCVHAHHDPECYPQQHVEHHYHLCYSLFTVGIARKAYYIV